MRFLRPTLLAAVAVLAAVAQTPTSAAKPAAKAAAKPAAAAADKTAHKSALDKATMEAYVRHLLLWNPQINIAIGDPQPAPIKGFKKVVVTGSYQKTSVDEVFYVSDDGLKIVRGLIYDVELSPFDEQLKKLKTDLSPSLGTPGAKVVMVVFTDFQCPHCKELAKSLRENLIKTYPTDVRLYLKEFPLESLHPWAKAAAMAGRCVYRQDAAAFWDYHDFVFDNQDSLTADNLKTKVLEWAATKNLDTIQIGSCIDTKATEKDIDRMEAEGKDLGINQTPSIFINGRPLAGNIPWEVMKQYIDHELEYAKKHNTEVEECCTVGLPVPGAGVKK